LRVGDPRLKMVDLQYHDMRPERCLAIRAGLETMVDSESVTQAVDSPPETTRAYFRGMCLKKWPKDVVAANWDSIVFDIGKDPLKRLPMMEPLKGTKVLIEELISRCASPAELVAALGDEITNSNFKPSN